MPIYVNIQSKSYGSVTQQSGDTQLAGRNSNVQAPLSADFSLTYDWGYEFAQPHNDSFGAANHSQAALETQVWFKIPLYHSIPAQLLNVMANKDTIDTVDVYEVDRQAKGGSQVTRMHLQFSNAIVTNVELVQGDQRDPEQKGSGAIKVTLKAQKIQYDDKIINVSGHLDTTNAA